MQSFKDISASWQPSNVTFDRSYPHYSIHKACSNKPIKASPGFAVMIDLSSVMSCMVSFSKGLPFPFSWPCFFPSAVPCCLFFNCCSCCLPFFPFFNFSSFGPREDCKGQSTNWQTINWTTREVLCLAGREHVSVVSLQTSMSNTNRGILMQQIKEKQVNCNAHLFTDCFI